MSADVRPGAGPRAVPAAARRARSAVTALFWLNGATWSLLVPRYPELKAVLGLDNAGFGIAVAIGPIGGLVGALLTGSLIRRFGSARVAVAGQAAAGLAVVALGSAQVAWWFSGALFVLALFDAFTDVAMNAHGLRVQRLYRRSIIQAFHGWWSIGAVCGGVVGAGLAQIGLPLVAHALLAGALSITVALIARRSLLPGAEDTERSREAPAPTVPAIPPEEAGPHAAPRSVPHAAQHPVPQEAPAGRRRLTAHLPLRTVPLVIALGLVGAFAGSVEDTGATWGAIYMSGQFGAVPFVAGLAFVALQGAQTLGRLTGDAVVQKLGNRGTARLGTAIGAAGMMLALLVPHQATTLVGFACAGWGIATLIPSAFDAADELEGAATGAGLAVVGWLMRIGFFVSPPLIGLLADAFTLRQALFVLPAALLAAGVLSGALRGRATVAQRAAARP